MDHPRDCAGAPVAVGKREAETASGSANALRRMEATEQRLSLGSEGKMTAVTIRPLWSLVAESFQDAARERGLIDPAGRCLPPPFGCGEKPANSYGMCVDCIFELRDHFGGLDGNQEQSREV